MTALHQKLMAIDRGIYAAVLLLPGVTDYSCQLAIAALLSSPGKGHSVLGPNLEGWVLGKITTSLPPPRMLNTFVELRKQRVNNSRTRKLILRTILRSKRLELWVVKYRGKIRPALEHAWGKRTTGILRSILGKDERTAKEERILQRNIDRYIHSSQNRETVYQCLSFVLGNRNRSNFAPILPLLKAYDLARSDLSKGGLLPWEVLEGIRGRFHPAVDPTRVLEMTRKRLTGSQKMTLQRKGAWASCTWTRLIRART